MKKSNLLKDCLLSLKEGIEKEKSYNSNLDEDAKSLGNEEGILISVRESYALVELLESLRWVAKYEGCERYEIGQEYFNFEEADNMGRLAEGFDYVETIGIIRIKDNEQ